MERIKRIQTFLDDYKTKDKWLRDLCVEVKKDYIKQLKNEWIKVSNHPFPEEYLQYQNDSKK